MSDRRPNVLFVMTDQQRADTIAGLGNSIISTPNLDRLVSRSVAFANAYSTCPVCVPARYTIRTGCEPPTTANFQNGAPTPAPGQPEGMRERCGPYLAERMRELGYRTFGIGKFHSRPRDEDLGYEVHLHSEEGYGPGQRERDAYARWVAEQHPEYDFQEGLMGERTEMYYVPQMSHVPAQVAVEHWAATQAVLQISRRDPRPYFGLVSFVGPHPPFAPPIPFNRMYDPDRMGEPTHGALETDFMDQNIPFMNQIIWAEEINAPWYRIAKARYYGEISYIDWCFGKILDAVDSNQSERETVICFFSDHGEHLGDHHAWQKESFFQQACNVPFLLSWPGRLPGGTRSDALVSLADLFGIATGAAGSIEVRDGIDLAGALEDPSLRRTRLQGWHGDPGTRFFKTMVREADWKYIYLANGGMEQLFNLARDPEELVNVAASEPTVTAELRRHAQAGCANGAARAALNDDGSLKRFGFAPYTAEDNPYTSGSSRVYQFDASRGVRGFPERPEDAVTSFDFDRYRVKDEP